MLFCDRYIEIFIEVIYAYRRVVETNIFTQSSNIMNLISLVTYEARKAFDASESETIGVFLDRGYANS